MGGWGAVLPYLYADIASARGLGGAAPRPARSPPSRSARCSPRRSPGGWPTPAAGAVAAAARAGDGRSRVVALALGRAADRGLAGRRGRRRRLRRRAARRAGAAARRRPRPAARRDVFAWQFIANNVGIAIGGLVGGLLVVLDSPTGVLPGLRHRRGRRAGQRRRRRGRPDGAAARAVAPVDRPEPPVGAAVGYCARCSRAPRCALLLGRDRAGDAGLLRAVRRRPAGVRADDAARRARRCSASGSR